MTVINLTDLSRQVSKPKEMSVSGCVCVRLCMCIRGGSYQFMYLIRNQNMAARSRKRAAIYTDIKRGY